MIAVGAVAVHRIVVGPWAENCYVASADGGDAIVIDPGGNAEQIAEHIAANRLRVHAVLATHGHPDHVSSLAEVTKLYGIPFGIHPDESGALRRINFYRFAIHRLGPVEVPPIDLDLATATILRFGALEVSVVHTPGHSPGSVCLQIGDNLFTGDTLVATHAGNAELPGFDRMALKASVDRLAQAYPPDMVVRPGHGRSVSLGEATARMSVTRA